MAHYAEHSAAEDILEHSELKRSITGRQLYFYVVGDVLGSGIYVLVGLVAAAVGGAFWMAFLAGVAIAAITGLAYAELVTKYPQAAGASLYINKAFRSPILTFFITICMLSANMAAVGSLASGFVRYFSGLVGISPDSIWLATIVALVFVSIITLINLIGITESVVVNVIMTFIELSGLVIVMIIGVIALVTAVKTRGAAGVQLGGFAGHRGAGGRLVRVLRHDRLRERSQRGRGDHRPGPGLPAGADRRHADRRRGLRPGLHFRRPGRAHRHAGRQHPARGDPRRPLPHPGRGSCWSSSD